MAIKTGEVADADEVMDAIVSNFIDNSQLLFNADYIGFDSKLNNDGVPQLDNLDYSTFTSDNMTKTNFRYNGTSDYYLSGVEDINLTTLDEFNDSSIDTAIWDTGKSGGTSVIDEDASDIRIKITGIDGTNAWVRTDNAIFSTYGNNVRIWLTSLNEASGSGHTSSFQLFITDGTNNVLVYTRTDGGTGSAVNKVIDIVLSATDTVQVNYDQGSWTEYDISSVTGTRKLQMMSRTNGGTPTGTTSYKVNWIRYYSGPITSTLISPTETSTSTITNAVLVLNNNIINSATFTSYLSADGGSNYEQVTLNQIHRFTNTGTQLKVKIESTDIDNEYDGIKLFEYAVKYNLY